MPLSTRDWAKREIERACSHVDWVGMHLMRVVDRYKELHPEISEPLEALLVDLLRFQEGVNGVEKTI